MTCRTLIVALFVMLALTGCNLTMRLVETSGSTPNVTLTPTPYSVPTLSAKPQIPRIDSTPSPTRIVGVSTPFVDAETVYLRERYQGELFASSAEWLEKFERWKNRRPTHPGILKGIKGLSVALRTTQSSKADSKAANDKWIHCVTGASIANEIDIGTAEFVAWLKEFQDLSDGFIETHFDEVDFKATVDGARQTEKSKCTDCANVCEARWGKRNLSWSGDLPIFN